MQFDTVSVTGSDFPQAGRSKCRRRGQPVFVNGSGLGCSLAGLFVAKQSLFRGKQGACSVPGSLYRVKPKLITKVFQPQCAVLRENVVFIILDRNAFFLGRSWLRSGARQCFAALPSFNNCILCSTSSSACFEMLTRFNH